MVKARHNVPSRARLEALLNYDPKSGCFTWKHPQLRGKIAGTIYVDGYRYLQIDGERWKTSRLAWLLVHGAPLPDVIDHIDCDKSNDRIFNLRASTKSQNGANRHTNKNNKSGVKGVSWDSGRHLWSAKLMVNGKTTNLGRFALIDDAAAAYEKAARAAWGEFARPATSNDVRSAADEKAKRPHEKHGMFNHPLYRSWRAMKQRCTVKSSPAYPEYGGRGIKVCDRWFNSFSAFWEDTRETWQSGFSIERIDPDGNYEPSNVRWANPKHQANNRRYHRLIPTPGGVLNVSQAAEAFGVNRNTIARRMRDGWPLERLLEEAQFSTRWHSAKQEP